MKEFPTNSLLSLLLFALGEILKYLSCWIRPIVVVAVLPMLPLLTAKTRSIDSKLAKHPSRKSKAQVRAKAFESGFELGVDERFGRRRLRLRSQLS